MVYIPFYRFWFILKYFVRMMLGALGIQTCTSFVHHVLDDHAGHFFHSFLALTSRHGWCTSLRTVFGHFEKLCSNVVGRTWDPDVHLMCAPWFGRSCRSFFPLFFGTNSMASMVYIPSNRFWFILKNFVRMLLRELGIQMCTSFVHHVLDDHAGRFFHSFSQ